MKKLLTDAEVAEMAKLVKQSDKEWRVFFARYDFTFPKGDMMNHPSNMCFARVVETEHAAGHMVDFPIARRMFMLGYMKGHDAFPRVKDCGLFSDAQGKREGET